MALGYNEESKKTRTALQWNRRLIARTIFKQHTDQPLFHAVLPSKEGPRLPLSVPEATVVSRDFITKAVEFSPITPPIFNKFVLYNSLH